MFTYHCSVCGIEASGGTCQDTDHLFCPDHPGAVIDSVLSSKPRQCQRAYAASFEGIIYGIGETEEGAIADALESSGAAPCHGDGACGEGKDCDHREPDVHPMTWAAYRDVQKHGWVGRRLSFLRSDKTWVTRWASIRIAESRNERLSNGSAMR